MKMLFEEHMGGEECVGLGTKISTPLDYGVLCFWRTKTCEEAFCGGVWRGLNHQRIRN